mmetsp:Transcript_130401/g.183954  ORF Transcript_130401/g.183954 Transcript_130401/m.183954 type:complete len:100 (+) Transcript_130401:120-419(+)
MAAARAKKERMMEMEEDKKKNVPPTETELEKMAEGERLRKKAALLANKDRDEVKEMDQMVLYAKVAAVRSQQIDEKKQIKKHMKVEEKTKDLMMELDRL